MNKIKSILARLKQKLINYVLVYHSDYSDLETVNKTLIQDIYLLVKESKQESGIHTNMYYSNYFDTIRAFNFGDISLPLDKFQGFHKVFKNMDNADKTRK